MGAEPSGPKNLLNDPSFNMIKLGNKLQHLDLGGINIIESHSWLSKCMFFSHSNYINPIPISPNS
jgi:hypothetical protein